MALYAPIVPILALLVGLCVPESPVYLMKRENTEGAARAVTRLSGPKYNVEEEVEIIKVSRVFFSIEDGLVKCKIHTVEELLTYQF